MLQTHHLTLDQDTLRDQFTLLVNHKILLAVEQKSQSQQIYRELIPIFDWGMERKLFHVDGYLRSRQYKNLYRLPLRLGNIEAAEHKINNLKKELPPEEKEEAFALAQGFLMFAKREFKQALNEIRHISTPSVHSRIAQKFLGLAAEYEALETPEKRLAQLSNVHSLAQFIRDQKMISSELKQFHLDRKKLYDRLIKANSIQKLEKLKKDCAPQTQFPDRDWLMEKIEEKIQYIKKWGEDGSLLL